jgi:hypothetical protein
MTLQAVCPSCFMIYNLPESLGGKRVRCKKCAWVFVAGGSTEPPATPAPERPHTVAATIPLLPERRQPLEPLRLKEEDNPRPRRRPGAERKPLPTGFLISAVALAIFLAAAGCLVVWSLLSSNTPPRRARPDFAPEMRNRQPDRGGQPNSGQPQADGPCGPKVGTGSLPASRGKGEAAPPGKPGSASPASSMPSSATSTN